MNPVKNTSNTRTWGLIYARAGLFLLIGLILFVSGNHYSLASMLFSGGSLILSGLLAIRFWQMSKVAGLSDVWSFINGLLDLLIGLALLIYHPHPTDNLILLFSLWGVLIGVFGAVETMFLFLGLRASSRAATDFIVIIINFFTFLLGGGLALILLTQPLGINSNRYAGLFIIGLGILIAVENRRLHWDSMPVHPD